MAFVKVQKNNTYFKRFQVKFRRRREGKTDYYQRKRLTVQRKNKYNTPKWRFVVRRTNQRIICQVVSSTVEGDKIKASADSFELKRFGLTVGLTNYSAAYCTGLLAGRRLLTVLDADNKKRNIESHMAKEFNLVPETTGEYVNIEQLAEKKGTSRPFVCFLDLGLARATKGNRVFAAMKGAVDGGIHIPHSDKIFPSKNDGKKGASLLRERIFGNHVQTYLNALAKENDKENWHCKNWQACLNSNKVKTTEELYKKVHAAIRANPARPQANKKTIKHERNSKNKQQVTSNGKTYTRNIKLTNQQRKQRVQEKIAKYLKERRK